jgi:hypothetical protein
MMSMTDFFEGLDMSIDDMTLVKPVHHLIIMTKNLTVECLLNAPKAKRGFPEAWELVNYNAYHREKRDRSVEIMICCTEKFVSS